MDNTSKSEAALIGDDRRGFFVSLAAIGLGAVACLVPAVTGLVAFLSPLRQRSQAGEPIRLTTLDALPEDGTPQLFPIIADRTDAWNLFPNEQIGAVYVRRVGDGAKAWNVICPHAGCTVVLAETEDKKTKGKTKKFFCPCHGAGFDIRSGRRLEKGSDSPRPLDELVVDPKRLKEEREVWVTFQNFQQGTADKVALT